MRNRDALGTARTPRSGRQTTQELDARAKRLAADVLGAPDLLQRAAVGMTDERTKQALQDLGGVEGLVCASEPDLRAVRLSPYRARILPAAFELGRLTVGQRPVFRKRLAHPRDVYLHMRARLSATVVEEFWAIALDVRHRVVLDTMLARGCLTGVEVHPRDVFRVLIKVGAAAVIFFHNHPSGDTAPSAQDLDLTTRLRTVGDVCGITVLDHVVVGACGYVSLAQRGWR